MHKSSGWGLRRVFYACDVAPILIGLLCIMPQSTNAQPGRSPPDAFRGIKWDSALPSIPKLRKTALSGCTTVVQQENLTVTPPCSHMHIDEDDMDLFTQRQNVAPIFGVPVSEQLLTWSYRKFWSGEVFIFNYRAADLATLRAALINRYGSPTLDDTEHHRTDWNWPNEKFMIRLSFDPVPKPSIGGNPKGLQTSISLAFTKIE